MKTMPNRDSFDAVAAWLNRNADPKQGNIGEIRWALQDIHERLAKVRAISPTCDLTERMWMLMERAGLPVKPIKPRRLRIP